MATHQPESDRLIAEYLRELKVSAWIRGVPRAQTQALQDEVRSSIEAALAEAGDRDEATVYRVLDQLGPPGSFVQRLTAAPRSASQQAVDTLLTPVTRVRAVMAERGWGWAEIGGLLLLGFGPFVLWWIGPIFGIILVRVAANRWAHKATRRATGFIVGLFALEAVIAVGLLAYVLLSGGPFFEQMQRVFSNLAPGRAGQFPLLPGLTGAQPISPVEILMSLPAYVAGVGSGVYLALSPRYRRRSSGAASS